MSEFSVSDLREVLEGAKTSLEQMLALQLRKALTENARLRQERDAANAQLDFILENTNDRK